MFVRAHIENIPTSIPVLATEEVDFLLLLIISAREHYKDKHMKKQ